MKANYHISTLTGILTGKPMQILLLLFAFGWCNALGQTQLSPENEDKYKQEFINYLPSLDEIYNAAVAKSAEHQYYLQEIDIRHQEKGVARFDWMKHISLDAHMGYGINDQLLIQENEDGNDINDELSTGRQNRYFAGVSVKLPIAVFFQRNNKMKIAKLRQEQALRQSEKIKEYLRNIATELYFTTQSAYETMLIKSNYHQSLRVLYEKSKKEFTSGQLSLNLYTDVEQKYFNALMEFKAAENQLKKNITKIEQFSGLKIKN
ncbi:MAG: TolC family protein [Marinifilaceae bacterium]